jgi:hypothetical protein
MTLLRKTQLGPDLTVPYPAVTIRHLATPHPDRTRRDITLPKLHITLRYLTRRHLDETKQHRTLPCFNGTTLDYDET